MGGTTLPATPKPWRRRVSSHLSICLGTIFKWPSEKSSQTVMNLHDSSAVAYIIGAVVWSVAESSWMFTKPDALFFWAFLLLIVPYYISILCRDRLSRQTTTLSILTLKEDADGFTQVDRISTTPLKGDNVMKAQSGYWFEHTQHVRFPF